MLFKPFAGVCLLVASSIADTDYCQLSCGDTKNVACDSYANDGWADSCKDQEIFNMTDEYIQAIVDVHNKNRNSIALGEIEHYDSAARMAKMRWDPDLAYTAEMNVRSCKYGHDGCRRTEKYSIAGQNIAIIYTDVEWDRNITSDRVVELSMTWFDEYKNGEPHGWMDMINELKAENFDSSKPVVGHFTQWVQSKAEAVGCAGVFSTMKIGDDEKEWGAFYIACNYAYGNLMGSPVYEAGVAASKCLTGPDATYSGLCTEEEDFSK